MKKFWTVCQTINQFEVFDGRWKINESAKIFSLVPLLYTCNLLSFKFKFKDSDTRNHFATNCKRGEYFREWYTFGDLD